VPLDHIHPFHENAIVGEHPEHGAPLAAVATGPHDNVVSLLDVRH
jgi:hypothetical protein